MLIVVPRITLLLSFGPVLEFGSLQGGAGCIPVGRGIQELPAIRMQPGAGRFTAAIGKPRGIATVEVQKVNLIKRVCRFAFALENHALPIRTEIAFPCAFTGKSQLPCPTQKGIRNARRFLGRRSRYQSTGGRHEKESAEHSSNTPPARLSVNQSGSLARPPEFPAGYCIISVN